MKVNLAKAKKIIKKYRCQKGTLMPLLQDIQSAYGYVPEDSIELIAQELEIYPVEIYGILTFYTQFRLTRPGKHILKVCQGTACHVMGGKELLDYLSDKLGIKEGGLSQDGRYSLERVACLGCCGMAPVIVVDNDFYGRCTLQNLDKILAKYR